MKVSVRQLAVCHHEECSDDIVVLDTRGRLWFASFGSGPRDWKLIELPDEPKPGVVEDAVDRLVGMMSDGDTLRISRTSQRHCIVVECSTLCCGKSLGRMQVADIRDVKPSELFRLAESVVKGVHVNAANAESQVKP